MAQAKNGFPIKKTYEHSKPSKIPKKIGKFNGEKPCVKNQR